jgi:hypothetical protein
VLSNGAYASIPGWGSNLHYHTDPTYAAGSCPFKYYAYMGSVSLSGSTALLTAGQTRDFSINKPSYTTVTWSIDTRFLEIISGQNTSTVTVKGKCGPTYSGNQNAYVKATLSTGCGSRAFQSNFVVDCGINPCEGTINGSYLNTVNGVPANYSNTVAMNGVSVTYTWTKTSGTTNYWYTGSNGKYLYFSLPSGATANFNVISNTGCNRTIGFATGFSYSTTSSNEKSSVTVSRENSDAITYKILIPSTGKVLKEGTFKTDEETSAYQGLQQGLYIIETQGRRKKIIVH